MNILDFMNENPGVIPYGFVSPDGDFFHSDFLNHIADAETICKAYHYDTSEQDALSLLEDLGWVHITACTFLDKGMHIMQVKDFLTEAQKSCLRPLLENPPMPFTKSTIHFLKYEFPDIFLYKGV